MIISDLQLDLFLKDIYNLYGDDFIHYNYSTLKRRINVHAIKLHIDNFDDYIKSILYDKHLYKDMFYHFSINVTEFFREPEQLKILRDTVLPYLNSYNHIKIWCAGCSSGESPYSLAMILDEENMLHKTQIYATDFNNRILAHAKDGLFDIENFKQSYTNYELSGGKKQFKEYFIKKGKFYQIKHYLKDHILFCNHNLATDSVINEFQLIICKNVIIYFDEILKNRVIKLFNDSLEANGFLILGESEYLPQEFENNLVKYIPHSQIYHKKIEGKING